MGLREFMADEVKVKLLHPHAKVPTRAYTDAACWDLYLCEKTILQPWQGRQMNIGLAFQLPRGWVGKIYTRSSHGFKGLRVHLGIIDADYRGPVSPFMINHTAQIHAFNAGERIAQIYFEPVPATKMRVVQKLTNTKRGVKGYGSSGK